jgi:hypothetical protein
LIGSATSVPGFDRYACSGNAAHVPEITFTARQIAGIPTEFSSVTRTPAPAAGAAPMKSRIVAELIGTCGDERLARASDGPNRLRSSVTATSHPFPVGLDDLWDDQQDDPAADEHPR